MQSVSSRLCQTRVGSRRKTQPRSQLGRTEPALQKSHIPTPGVCACLRSVDPPDLPEHVHFHSLISTIVHVADLHFIAFLIGGHHLGSPPGTIHAGGSTDDRYCRSGRERVDTPGIVQGTKGHPPSHVTSQGPVSPQGWGTARSLQSFPEARDWPREGPARGKSGLPCMPPKKLSRPKSILPDPFILKPTKA